MAKYSTFKYGDGTKYGTPQPDADILWGILIKWDNADWGASDGNNEAIRAVDLSISRGRDEFTDVDGIVPYGAGRATITLDNDDGRYDVYNAAGPIYGDILPGKEVWIMVRDEPNSMNYDVFFGTIVDIQPFRHGDRNLVRIDCRDGLNLLNTKINSVLYSSPTLAEIAAAILDEVSWPWETDLDTSDLMDDTLDYWWAWAELAGQVVDSVLAGQAANYFHSREGKFTVYARDYTHNRTKAVDESEILRDFSLAQPWDVIRNEIFVSAIPRKAYAGAVQDLFLLIQTIDLLDGQTLTFDISIQHPNFPGRIAPDPATVSFDFAVWTGEITGVGDNLTGDCELDYDSPVSEGTRVSITNNSGQDGNLTYLWMGGKPIYPQNKALFSDEDATSQAAYGLRSMSIDKYWQDNQERAQDIADELLAALKDPFLKPIIQVENRPAIQFYLDLYDRVELTIPTKDIDDNFRVGGIEHTWLLENGNAVRTVLYLEPYFVLEM